MDPSSPEYIIVHKILDSPPDYNLMLLRKDDKYRILYACAIPHTPLMRWYDIDELTWWGVRYLDLPFNTFVGMGEFIREYVGEARWILAVLAST